MSVKLRLRTLFTAARTAYAARVEDPRGRTSIEYIFGELDQALTPRDGAGERLPACDWLDEFHDPDGPMDSDLRDVIEAFLALEPELRWRKRTADVSTANDAFADGHGYTMIVGPGGLVPHDSVWMGFNVQGPGVRYPDHTHPPEETYLVLSDGEFYQDGRGWFTPGIGGTFYNPPGIVHAMRSGATPLLAMWVLRAV